MLWGSIVETQPNLFRVTVTNVGLNEPARSDERIRTYTIRANGIVRTLVTLSHLLGGVSYKQFRKMWSYDRSSWALGFNMEPRGNEKSA